MNRSVVSGRTRVFGALTAVAILLATPLQGQRGAGDSVRLNRVAAGLRANGYTHPLLLAHGTGTAEALLVASVTARSDSGILLATMESASASVHPVVLEWARTPADLGVKGVQLTSFLGARDLIDIEVSHQPFMLETSRTFNTHHVVRRQGDVLSAVCDLEGGSSSSYSKGIGSNTTTRDVTIAKVPATAVTFSVRTIARTVQRRDGDAAPTTDSSATVKWYELPAIGSCREVRAP